MEKEKQTKELEIALTTYIAMKHNQDECSGFIDGFKKAMKLINKDSVLHSIIHSQPQHGFYYWVKHWDDSEYEVALAVMYMKEIHFEFTNDRDNFPFPKDVSDWKKIPIKPFNEADYG